MPVALDIPSSSCTSLVPLPVCGLETSAIFLALRASLGKRPRWIEKFWLEAWKEVDRVDWLRWEDVPRTVRVDDTLRCRRHGLLQLYDILLFVIYSTFRFYYVKVTGRKNSTTVPQIYIVWYYSTSIPSIQNWLERMRDENWETAFGLVAQPLEPRDVTQLLLIITISSDPFN